MDVNLEGCAFTHPLNAAAGWDACRGNGFLVLRTLEPDKNKEDLMEGLEKLLRRHGGSGGDNDDDDDNEATSGLLQDRR